MESVREEHVSLWGCIDPQLDIKYEGTKTSSLMKKLKRLLLKRKDMDTVVSIKS